MKSYEIREQVYNGANYETANSWTLDVKAGETPCQAFARECQNTTIKKDCAGSKLVLVEIDEDEVAPYNQEEIAEAFI